MKKSILLVVAALLLTCCSTSKLTQQQKAEREKQLQNEVFAAVNKKTFTIDVGYMSPLRGANRAVSHGYNIRLSGDSIYSSLPYTGVAQAAGYGNVNPMSFEKKFDSYECMVAPDGKSMYVELIVRNNEDRLQFVMNIFNNGTAAIRVVSPNRDPISYSGELNDIIKKVMETAAEGKGE